MKRAIQQMGFTAKGKKKRRQFYGAVRNGQRQLTKRVYAAIGHIRLDRLGSKWIENDRLFTKWNGMPMNPQTPYGWLNEFCDKHNLPFYGLHSFRHFAASALISAGLDVTTVSRALGHESATTTLSIYSHMFQTAQAKVAEAMDEAFDFLSKKT